MLPTAPTSVEDLDLGDAFREAIAQRYGESGAERFGISRESFVRMVSAVVMRYAAEARDGERRELTASLRVDELVLARACAAGNEAAWEVFLVRFRAALYETAYRVAKDEAGGRELADSLYADLYGMPNREGRRVSKLDYYMGRGSLEGWLRMVLAQQYVDRCRAHSKEVSLEEQIESGVSFSAKAAAEESAPDGRISEAVARTLAELDAEQRFLLASYYLDQRTLAEVGRQLRVHESTVCRKLERLTKELRKRVRKRLQAAGITARRCDEILKELDVRDLNVDVAGEVRQESPRRPF